MSMNSGRTVRAVAGITLVELLIAIASAAILVPLIFGAYRTFVRGSIVQSTRVQSVNYLIRSRAAITHEMRRVQSVKEIRPKVFAVDTGNGMCEVKATDGALWWGSQKLVTQVSAFELRQETQGLHNALYWDLTAKGGTWIGGARLID